MTSDSDDCIYTTPPTSPLIHELDPDDSPDMVAWKMDIVDDHVAKLSALLKNDELDIIRIEALKSTKVKRWRMKMQEKRKRQLQQRRDDPNLGVRTVPTIGKKDQPALRHTSRPINTISAPGYGLSDDSDISDSDSPVAPAKNTATGSSAAPPTHRTLQTSTSPFILAPVSNQPLNFGPILANNTTMPTALKADLRQKQSTQAQDLYSQVVQHQEDVYRLNHPSHTRNTPPNLYSGPPPTAPRGHFQNQLPAHAPPVTYGEYPPQQSYQYHQYQYNSSPANPSLAAKNEPWAHTTNTRNTPQYHGYPTTPHQPPPAAMSSKSRSSRWDASHPPPPKGPSTIPPPPPPEEPPIIPPPPPKQPTPPPQSKEPVHPSHSSRVLKKQNYQSPLATFGISASTTRPGETTFHQPLCVFEAEGGTCNDDTCRSKHFRDF